MPSLAQKTQKPAGQQIRPEAARQDLPLPRLRKRLASETNILDKFRPSEARDARKSAAVSPQPKQPAATAPGERKQACSPLASHKQAEEGFKTPNKSVDVRNFNISDLFLPSDDHVPEDDLAEDSARNEKASLSKRSADNLVRTHSDQLERNHTFKQAHTRNISGLKPLGLHPRNSFKMECKSATLMKKPLHCLTLMKYCGRRLMRWLSS